MDTSNHNVRIDKDVKATTEKLYAEISPTVDFFEAVAKQSASKSAAIYGIIDAALCNADGKQAQILLSVDKVSPKTNLIRFTVADWGKGMDADALINALQFGDAHANDEDYPYLYGMDLSTAMLIISQNRYNWLIASRADGQSAYNLVKGPFALKMSVNEGVEMPLRDIVMSPELDRYGEPSTIVSVITDYDVVNAMLSDTLYRIDNLDILRRALAEHLGVKYRGFLAIDDYSGEAPARILLRGFSYQDKTCVDIFLRPITPPYRTPMEKSLKAKVGRYTIPVKVEYGLLDKQSLEKLVMGEYAPSFYYAYNEATQGFDIQLGRRTIASAQFESIWGLKRHPSFNAWTGNIIVDVEKAKLPRKLLNTLVNKSGIDINAPGWQAIFDAIRKDPELSPRVVTVDTISTYINDMRDTLALQNPSHRVEVSHHIFANAAQIDLLDIESDGTTCTVYCIKNRTANISDLSELLMFCMGAMAQGLRPKAGVLVCKKHGPMMAHICTEWNQTLQLMSPDAYDRILTEAGGDISRLLKYNFEIVEDPNIPD